MKIFFDMDDTLAKFDCHKIENLEKMYNKHFFLNLKPTALAKHLSTIKATADFYIVSACPISDYVKEEKMMSIKRYLPYIDTSHIILINVGENKVTAVKIHLGYDLEDLLPTNYVLIDDYSENLYTWEQNNGTAIKVVTKHNNKKGNTYKYKFTKFTTLMKIINQLKRN